MAENYTDPKSIISIELLEQEVEKVFLIADKGLVRMVVATVIANRMALDPVWLLLVAPPSGGKTEMIMALSGLEFVYPISDITVNTFASGQKKVGKETSLLLKVNNGLLAFKDFTSILSKNREARAEILKQLREIFDGEYVKRTGTGDDVTWKGKVGVIAGSTEVVYRYLEDLSAMGDRFIMYSVDQPNRLEVARRALENANDIADKRNHLKDCFTHFIKSAISKIDAEEVQLSDETREELLLVADFATQVRSAVMTDFKSGNVDFVPKKEMPMRLTSQLYTLASAFIAINKTNPNLLGHSPAKKGELTEEEKKLLFKTAFDSIPRTRRDAIIPLAQYTGGITTAGLATRLNLPTDSARKYLQQVNALDICTRKRQSGAQGDLWTMPDKFRRIMMKVEKFDLVDQVLTGNDLEKKDEISEAEAWEAYDNNQKNRREEEGSDESLNVLL